MPKKPFDNYLKYSALGLQMAVMVGLFFFAGRFLDNQFSLSKPFLTLVFGFIGVLGAVWWLIRDLSNNSK